MAIDVDTMLLDRVFQPAADGACAWASCFDLARSALAGVALLQTVVLAHGMSLGPDTAGLGLMATASVIQYWAVGLVLRQIRRAERQTRSGMMNLARITLHGGTVSLCPAGANVLWVVAVYLMSCVASSPSVRVGRRMVAQGAC